MYPFLNKVFDHIQQNFPRPYKNICVLVPTRRSWWVLKHVFEQHQIVQEEQPVFFAIEDFIVAHAGLKKAEQVELLLELQEIFKEVASVEKDNLMSWLPTLLKDFNRIDQNLVDAKQVFSNLADVERMKSWNREAHLSPDSSVQYYFKFWNELLKIYHAFKQRLKKLNKAYLGMMYRELAAKAESLLLATSPYEHFVFAGFNALTQAEEKIIRTLQKAKKATLLWDSDTFYMREGIENQSGTFLKKYKQDSFLTPSTWLWEEDNLRKAPKNIEVIATTNASMQAKVAQSLLKKWPRNSSTAIVLADENMLLPLMYSLDNQEFNVTMGLSLQSSTLYNLINSLFELQQSQRTFRVKKKKANPLEASEEFDVRKYHYKNIIKVLNHPFIRKYEQLHHQDGTISFIRDFINYIVRMNKAYMSKREIVDIAARLLENKQDATERDLYEKHYAHFQPLLGVLFDNWGNENIARMLGAFDKLIEFFWKVYEQTNDLEKEYIRKFRDIIHELRRLLRKRKYQTDVRSFKIFLYQLIREERIAFDSQRQSNLQIMGMLETRCLDFEQVIVLSTNEGKLPPAKKQGSLIPFDIARSFQIPTYLEQEAIISYHFYRLLQRASQVALVYVSPGKTYGAAEKSRFILQLENDLLRHNTAIQWQSRLAKTVVTSNGATLDLEIYKSEEILEMLKQKLADGISPSAIDTFVRCSLKYYFQYIAGIQQANEIEEELGNDQFGVILHGVLEDIFKEISQEGKPVGIHDLQAQIPLLETRIKQKFKTGRWAGYEIIGNNFLAQQVILKYATNFLEAQVQELQELINPEVGFRVLGLETRKPTEQIEGEEAHQDTTQPAEFTFLYNQSPVKVSIKGIVDRIDQLEGVIRIVDYKTGKVEAKDLKLSLEQFNKLSSDRELSKARQVWMYLYMLVKNLRENPRFKNNQGQLEVQAGIYSMRNLKGKEKFLKFTVSDDSRFASGGIASKDMTAFMEHSENILKKIVMDLLDASQPFQKTDHLEECSYCNYKGICGR